MSEYVDFHYMPLEGKITGKQVLQQTEDAINDLGNKVHNLDVDESRIDEAIENSEQAINTANSALAAVTTDRAVWKNTVAEMKATDIDLGVTAATRGKNLYNDGDGAFYVVRQEKSGDIDGEDTVFLDSGNVAERLKQFDFIAKGNNIIYVENVASLREADAVIGNVYGTIGYYSANDGGAGVYNIRLKEPGDVEDGGSIIFLNNGNAAECIDLNIPRTFDTVADLKNASLFVGLKVSTKGYHSVNDGGAGLYSIRAKTTEDVIDEGSIIQIGDSYNPVVAELITDGTVNVKQFGAKGDGVTDDTDAMKNAFATSDTNEVFYIPNGLYIVKPKILNATLSHDITVFGDGKGATKLKLKDNSVTADNQPLFMINNSGFIRICFHDLYIDMNRANNKSVIDDSGDEWALQHCHAIFCYPQSVKGMSVDVHDVEFYDLIADGVGCGGSGTKTYVDIMCRNIVSTGRQGTRSDICVTASYDNLIVSDCVLDALETEVNYYASGHNYIATIDNVVTDKIDLDSDWKNTTADTQPQTRIANSVIREIVAIIGGYYVFDDCQITLVRPTRLNSSMSIFTNCKIETKSITTGNAVFDSQASNTDAGIEFHNCDISNPYYNSIPFISMIGNATYAKHIVFDNCKINFASALFSMRSGNLFFTNNTVNLIQVDGETPPSAIGSIGSLNMDILAIIKDNNILSPNLGIITPPIAGSYKFYLNSRGNKTATLGLAINWTRYDKITASRGGSGSIVECEVLDEYQASAEPTTGKWVKGQKVYNTNPSASPLVLGWVCTTSGNAGTAVFTEF